MQLVILCSEEQKGELIKNGVDAGVQLIWVDDVRQVDIYREADAFIDLLFEPKEQRLQLLQQLLPKPVLINSVLYSLKELHPSFIRINGWPTFLQNSLIEGSCFDDHLKEVAEGVLLPFYKNIEWLDDEPGFIVPRVISTIINEAYFSLAEGVSTKEEIDTAMKLGTNYPYGPFEWSEKIGLQNIATLLTKLAGQQRRYTPCELLVQETNKAI